MRAPRHQGDGHNPAPLSCHHPPVCPSMPGAAPSHAKSLATGTRAGGEGGRELAK